ncbi:MAG: hypothetical protein KA956_01635 [Pyrinomonadaceae bacterium]|nr:hypothetical protein [Acidobacteriota bacterium]MBP7375156.1 hypothetical protein [Pyrinomonadaceae bacterium]
MADLEVGKVLVVEGAEEVVLDNYDSNLATRRPRKVYSGMWGVPEIAAISASAMILLLAILVYVFVVVPSTREVAKNRSEADRLAAELISAQTKYGEITDTKTQVAKLLTSVSDFETRFLPAATNGRTSLYQRINGLISAYGLTNTTGPDYQPLEPAGQDDGNNKGEGERGRERFRSLFPGVYVTMTVEGSYQNLRRFIREIETGNEFVVVSSVELAPSDTEEKKVDPTKPPPSAEFQPAGDPRFGAAGNPGIVTQPAAGELTRKPQGKTHGEIVALRLEMAAYFRRPDFVPVATE